MTPPPDTMKAFRGLGFNLYEGYGMTESSPVLTVTRLAAADLALLEPLRTEGAEVRAVPGATTTSIRNVFETADLDRRKVTLLAQGEAFRPEDFPPVEVSACLLTGLFRGEIPDELLQPLSARFPLALDLQGVLRTSRDGVFAWQDWPAKSRLLPLIRFLKADALEAGADEVKFCLRHSPFQAQ